ncbi:MAG: hypothetical protein OEY25_13730 [Candidatus Aminicenantes bacterium]|nr:hypothetical protein [Candidatus Aminicenantes bacterium]MDH5705424.1 hypothetical protein [Candidatus Aminicenantes bacterium]
MKAKEIILLILIIVVGILFHQLYTGKIDVYFDLDDDFIVISNEFDYEDYQELEPPFPALLQVTNSYGDVEVTGNDEEKIAVTLRKKIWRRKEDTAQKIADELKMVIQEEADRLVISTSGDEFGRKNFKLSFKISVPMRMDVKVSNSYGTVDVANVKNVDITNPHGKIFASDITGQTVLENSYETVDVENIDADLELESHNSSVHVSKVRGKAHIVHRYGEIQLDDISGDVKVEGSHSEIYGKKLAGPVEIESSYKKITLIHVGPTKIKGYNSTIEVEGAKELLDVKNDYGKVRVNSIDGDLVIDGKNLEVTGKSIVGDKIDITSSYRDIELTEFSGKTTIVLSNGEIVLTPYPLTHPIEVKGEYANIKLRWPLGKKYRFEAKVKNGEIEWGLPVEISVQEEDHTRTVTAFIQEKESPSIFLSTSYRTIWVEQ